MRNQFGSFCELLWRSWLDSTLNLPLRLERRFDIDAAPEPYLPFDAGGRPLIAFTTNPGGTLSFQRRQAVLMGDGPISAAMDYASAALALGRHYRQILQRRPAGRRIESLVGLASLVSADGVLQVEACPFHSRSLPNKAALLADLQGDDLLSEYIGQLQGFLRERPVVIVSAVSSRKPLTPKTTLAPWLAWQADLAGMNLADSTRFVPLITRNGAPTCAAFLSSKSGVAKALVLMMGSNQLPGFEGLTLLGAAFRRFAQAG